MSGDLADDTDDDAARVPAAGADDAPETLTEHLAGDWGYFIRATRRLETVVSPFQAIDVHETASFGRLFRLDGHFMTSERDEFLYHENLVHVPAVAHPAPRRALVVGGGDGGSAEELLKHPMLGSVTICELDADVVAIARRHLGRVHRGALSDPRVTLVIGDGCDYVLASTAVFDLIVLDLTGPGGPATPVYSPAFYRGCAARLAADGALTLHVGSPFAHPDRVRAILGALRGAFPRVAPYLVSIPLYGGLWMMACASHRLDPPALAPDEVDRRLAARGIAGLGYYNGEVHRAGFALPNFVRDLVRA